MGGKICRRMWMGKKKMVAPEAELFSVYLDAYRTYANVRKLDGVLQEDTGRVIHVIANDVQEHSLSLKSFKEITTFLYQIDEEVAKVIFWNQKVIYGNPKLLNLVQEYFKNTLETLNFYTVLEKCLKKAKDDQLIIKIALQGFPTEGEGPPEEEECRKVLKELENFVSAGSPFSEEFSRQFRLVYERRKHMLDTLEAQRSKMNKKVKNARMWRKISSIIFVATLAALLICSVVVAAMAMPPLLTALQGAAVAGIEPMGKWVNSLWEKYEDTIERQLKVMDAMGVRTFGAVNDLDTIKTLVERLKQDIWGILRSVEFSMTHREAVVIVIKDMKNKQQKFMDDIEDLLEHVDGCRKNIRRARALVMVKVEEPTMKRCMSF